MFSYLQNPLVYINDVQSRFRSVETIDMDQDTSIKALFIDIPEGLKSKAIEVKFIGFKNPDFVENAIKAGTVEIQVLGSSIDRLQIRAIAQERF